MNIRSIVVCHNIAVDEVTEVKEFKTEEEARRWVESDIEKCTTEPFTNQGHPMWDKEDIDRSNPNRIKAADEFEYIFTDHRPNEGITEEGHKSVCRAAAERHYAWKREEVENIVNDWFTYPANTKVFYIHLFEECNMHGLASALDLDDLDGANGWISSKM